MYLPIHIKAPHLLLLATLSLLGPLMANRAIQIREVNFETSVMELYNFGTTDQILNGWRFCSHDDDQVRRYSSSSGLNGITIPAASSLFIHFLNDAPSGDATAINITGRGNFALPLDRGPYGIQLYINGSFGSGASIADHLQWSIDGVDNITADDRSDEAQTGGVWTDQSTWIATTTTSEKIILNDTSGGILHSPANYSALEPLVFPGTLAIESISAPAAGTINLSWQDLSEFGAINYTVETSADLDGDNWEPVFENPLQSTSTTITHLPAGPQFFRVIAEIAS